MLELLPKDSKMSVSKNKIRGCDKDQTRPLSSKIYNIILYYIIYNIIFKIIFICLQFYKLGVSGDIPGKKLL